MVILPFLTCTKQKKYAYQQDMPEEVSPVWRRQPKCRPQSREIGIQILCMISPQLKKEHCRREHKGEQP